MVEGLLGCDRSEIAGGAADAGRRRGRMPCMLWAIVGAALPITGCGLNSERVYEIDLEPGPAGIRRTFSGWEDHGPERANDRLPDDELARLGRMYSERLSQPNELRQKFRGVFQGRLPNDVGGRGNYQSIPTPLGTAHWYTERFGGHDDIDAQLYDRRAAVDALVDVVVGWVDEQLKESPRRDEVRRFLHQDIRQDVRKLSLTQWVGEVVDAESTQSDDTPRERGDELWYRVLHYALEHDYFEPQELPDLSTSAGNDPEMFLRLGRRLLVRKTGLDDASADRLCGLLTDQDVFADSVRAYVRSRPEYAAFLRKRGLRADDPTVATELEPLDYVTELGLVAFGIGGREQRTLRLTLQTASLPYDTNGRWDETRRAVTWHQRLNGPTGLPTFCYALWGAADEQFQQTHFGKVALTDATLAQFAARYAKLSPDQQSELAKHLAALEPGDALKGRVRDFAFVAAADDRAKETVGQIIELLSQQF